MSWNDIYATDTHGLLEITEVDASPAVVVRRTGFPTADLRELFDAGFHAIFGVLAESGIAPVGPAYSGYTSVPGETVDVEIGVPVSAPLPEAVPSTVDLAGEALLVENAVLPEGSVAVTSHQGSYDGLGGAWGAFFTRIEQSGEDVGRGFYEIYVTEPGPDVDPATLRTDLVVPLA